VLQPQPNASALKRPLQTVISFVMLRRHPLSGTSRKQPREYKWRTVYLVAGSRIEGGGRPWGRDCRRTHTPQVYLSIVYCAGTPSFVATDKCETPCGRYFLFVCSAESEDEAIEARGGRPVRSRIHMYRINNRFRFGKHRNKVEP